MPFPSWLSSTCVSSDTTVTISKTRNNVSSSDTSTASEIPSTSSSSSLPSNFSLQTFPSLPSLQKASSAEQPSSSSSTPTPLLHHLCLSSIRPHHPCHVSTLALSNSLLYVASSNQVSVWNLKTLSKITSFNGNGKGSVKSVAFSNGKVFTAHQDSKIRVWEVTDSKRRHHRLVTSLPTVSDRLRRFIFPANYVRVRRHRKRLWIEHADAVSSLAVSNGVIYSVSWDRSLKIWSASDLLCIESVDSAHDDAVNAVAVSGDGTVYTGSADRRIRVWGRAFGGKRQTLIATLEKHKSSVNALALNSGGSILYSGAKDRSILVWEREDSANYMVVMGVLRGHGGAILCLINEGDLLFSGSADRTVRIWRRGSGDGYDCLGVLEGHERPVKSLGAAWEGGERVVCAM
ncbi:hypothetical protein MRB53_016306 [Persea americana]|uniref:Uncharacterized protein n=1 Tax=Persea americana TaxID=3435 RepID=A0ACC2M1I8_PERAE|nr:hypothetical protein MRB53_016306 [Persea americana]